jgi:hypothetical protein
VKAEENSDRIQSLAFGGRTWGLLGVSGSTATVLWGREQQSEGSLCVSPDGSLVVHFDTRTQEVELVGRTGDDLARFRPGGFVQAALFLDGGRFLFLSSGRSEATRDATGAVIAESCNGWAALYDMRGELARPDGPERESHE